MQCPNCKLENPPDALQCEGCGNSLKERPLPVEVHSAPGSVNSGPLLKSVTVLSTALSAQGLNNRKLVHGKSPKIKGRIFTAFQQIVAKYDGVMQQGPGEAYLALFGIPMSHDEDAVRAIYAAWEIHEFVSSLNAEYQGNLEIPLIMQSGIFTGKLTPTDLDAGQASREMGGDAVKTASTLSSLANPGEILVGRDDRLKAVDFVSFEDAGSLKISEEAQSIQVFRVAGVRGLQSTSSFYRQITSEMVGRESELSLLEFQIIKAIMGEGSVVTVTGDAGIGKSRLIAELKKLEVMKKVMVVEGRASSIGRNLSFHPIIDLLKNWANISDSDADITKLDKLENAIRLIDEDSADEIFPFVATLMGLKLSGKHAERVQGIEGEALEKLIFKNVKELVFKGVQQRPIIVIMEDTHWADTSSMNLLAALYPIAEKHRIVFINVFRPGYLHTDYANVKQVGSQLNVSRLEIEIPPLDSRKSDTLIDNMLVASPVPQAIRHQIINRAGGNPFFIEELVYSLIDEGAVVRKGSGFEVTEQIDAVKIPSTVNDALMARIARLDQQTGELLKIASVLGKSFFGRVLRNVADSVENIDDKLAYLQSAQLIRVRMNMGELEYLFKHALIQEAAYDSMPVLERKRVHLRVAESIERMFGDRAQEYYGLLAYHYGKAESLDKTEEFLVKAGEESLKSSASNEALSYYQEALNLYLMQRGENVDPEKVAVLEKNIGQALFNRGLYADAVAHFDKALVYYWGELPKNSISTAARILSSFAIFLCALHYPSYWFRKPPTPKDVETVETYYKKAQALALIDPKRFFTEFFFFHSTAVKFDLTKLKFGMGIFASSSALFAFTGLSFNIARKVLDYAGPRLDQNNAKQLITYNLMDTQHLFLKGEWNKISEYDENLVEKMLRIGEVWDAAQHYYWHGLPKIFQGHFLEAGFLVSKLNELAEVYQNNIYLLLKYLLNIYLLIECREIKEARAEVDRGIELVKAENWPLSILNIYSLKASIDLLRNDMEQAEQSLDVANQIRTKMRVAPIQLSAFYRSQFEYNLRHFEHSLEDGLTEEASVYRRNAAESGKNLMKVCQKAALYRTDSYRLMGLFKSLINDHKGASKWWDRSIREGETLNALPQLSRTYAEIGVRMSANGGQLSPREADKCKTALKKAREMFTNLRLSKDLETLNLATDTTHIKPS